MKNKPLVAIRTLVYNHEPYLRDYFEGIVAQQTNFLFIAIVHDDCSTDGSADIIREYAEKYPHIIQPIYEAENLYSKGYELVNKIMTEACASAKYIAFCEGDDYWIDPKKLQKQVDFLESHPEIDLCCSASKIFNQSHGVFSGIGGTELCETYETAIQGGNDIFTATTLVRQTAWQRCVSEVTSFLPKDLVFDTAYWYWFAYHKKIKYMKESLAVYRVLENSASHTTDNETELKMAWRFLRLKLYFLAKYPLKNSQQEVSQCIVSEIETYVKNTRYFTDMQVHNSKTYRLGKLIKKLILFK